MDECMYLLQVDKEDTLKFKSQCVTVTKIKHCCCLKIFLVLSD